MIQHYNQKFKHYQAGIKTKYFLFVFINLILLYIRNLKRNSYSAAKHVADQLQSFMDMSSDDYESEIGSDDDDKQSSIYNKRKIIQPITSYRYVHRFNGNHSLTKMKNDESYRIHFLKTYAAVSDLPDTSEIVIEDSDIDDDDDDIVSENKLPIEEEHNLDDIREKTLQYDRQQIKGIQLANAGTNIKIINNYSVTSSTCIIM
jgi:hypothetical protein